MPYRKTDQGWFWGSKGPFPTKQKAMDVARAAYAHGFKESEMEKIIGEFVGTLLHSATIAHIKHLQTDSYSAHKALQSYYEGIVDLADSLAEAIQGCVGEIIDSYPPMFGNPESSSLDYLKSLREYVIANRDAVSPYSNIQNEIDGIMTLLDSTIYKLTFLK